MICRWVRVRFVKNRIFFRSCLLSMADAVFLSEFQVRFFPEFSGILHIEFCEVKSYSDKIPSSGFTKTDFRGHPSPAPICLSRFTVCPGCPATVFLSRLSCPSYLVKAVMFRPSYPLFLGLVVLFRLFWLAVLSWLLCQNCTVNIFPSSPSPLSCPCHVRTIQSTLSCLSILSLVSFRVVLTHLSCPESSFPNVQS